MSSQLQFERWYLIARRQYGIKVTSKDRQWKPLWKTVHWLLKILSLGKQNGFYNKFTTTLGKTIFYPAGWQFEKASTNDCVILRHEGRHVQQFLRWGLGNEYLGILIMGFFYLFLPLPICFAWFRYCFEREAYKVSYYATLELGHEPDIEHYVENLTGPKYLWTWVFKNKVRKWFKDNCSPDKLENYKPAFVKFIK